MVMGIVSGGEGMGLCQAALLPGVSRRHSMESTGSLQGLR